ncbi:hypothetical protein IAT38_008276 [Cryptococcus sp. DSM 104549]
MRCSALCPVFFVAPLAVSAWPIKTPVRAKLSARHVIAGRQFGHGSSVEYGNVLASTSVYLEDSDSVSLSTSQNYTTFIVETPDSSTTATLIAGWGAQPIYHLGPGYILGVPEHIYASWIFPEVSSDLLSLKVCTYVYREPEAGVNASAVVDTREGFKVEEFASELGLGESVAEFCVRVGSASSSISVASSTSASSTSLVVSPTTTAAGNGGSGGSGGSATSAAEISSSPPVASSSSAEEAGSSAVTAPSDAPGTTSIGSGSVSVPIATGVVTSAATSTAYPASSTEAAGGVGGDSSSTAATGSSSQAAPSGPSASLSSTTAIGEVSTSATEVGSSSTQSSATGTAIATSTGEASASSTGDVATSAESTTIPSTSATSAEVSSTPESTAVSTSATSGSFSASVSASSGVVSSSASVSVTSAPITPTSAISTSSFAPNATTIATSGSANATSFVSTSAASTSAVSTSAAANATTIAPSTSANSTSLPISVSTTSTSAAPNATSTTVSPSPNPAYQTNVTFAGKTYINKGLVGFGAIPGDAVDSFGETIGGIGSAIALQSFERDGDSYKGVFAAQPDRGHNTATTTDYVTRRHLISFTLNPYYNTTALEYEAAKSTFQLAYDSSLRYFEQDGTPTSGLDALGVRNASVPEPIASATYNHISTDPEGLVLNSDGTSWVSDEYGPYIWKYSAAGTLLETIVPPHAVLPYKNGALNFTSEADPGTGRVPNQGFEGLTVSADGNTLYALLQSGLVQDLDSNDEGRYTRLFVYDVSSTPTLRSSYVLKLPVTNGKGKALSQSDFIHVADETFILLSRDGKGNGNDDSESKHKDFMLFNLDGATDIAQTEYTTGVVPVAPKGVLNSDVTAIEPTEFIDIIDDEQLARFGIHNSGDFDVSLINGKWESSALASVQDPEYPNDYFFFSFSDNDFITPNGYEAGEPYVDSYSTYSLDNQALVWRITLP